MMDEEGEVGTISQRKNVRGVEESTRFPQFDSVASFDTSNIID